MKLANLVGERFKERPSDCVIDSHAYSIRGGYIKYVASGILNAMVFNVHHRKAVPGRKADVKDAERIANLLQHGLL